VLRWSDQIKSNAQIPSIEELLAYILLIVGTGTQSGAYLLLMAIIIAETLH